MEANEFASMIDQCTDFYYGKQWEKSTKYTKRIPKPVLNICRLIVDSKQANIVSTTTKLVFQTNNSHQETSYFTNFCSYLLKEMQYEKKHRSLLTKNALIKGISYAYLYWDSNAIGTYGDYVGGLRMERLDAKKVALSNPMLTDIQDQEWIIICSRNSVKSLKSKVKNKNLIIKPDNFNEGVDDVKEIDDNDLCTTYLKFYRKNGEVLYTLTTADVVIEKDKPLNPNLYKIDVDEIDGQHIAIPAINLNENNVEDYQEIKFNRYPIQALVLKESDKSIYGVSELKDIINTQKYINHLYSMQLLNVQNTAWDKYIVSKGALRNQIITDEPGQVLVDHSPTGNGIRRMGGMNAMANGTIDLANNVFEMAKTINQTNDVFLGQTEQDLSGVATSLYQAQNEMPIDDMRKKLWAFEEELGKTIELFMKLYYSKQEYYYELDDATIIRNKMINSMDINSNLPTDKFQTGIYDSNDFKNVKFHVTVEAMQGSRDSIIKLNNLMEALFLNGAWGNMNVHARKLFVEMYDMPEKDKFRALIEQEENEYISQLENQVQTLVAQNQQLQNSLKRSQNTIDYYGKFNTSMQQQYKNEVTAHQQDLNKFTKLLSEKENSNNNIRNTKNIQNQSNLETS